MKPIRWSYGVTTVPSRLDTLLPRTLQSLANAGFDKPRLFVDGKFNATIQDYRNHDVTCRVPAIRAYGNWILALGELYLRQPRANRFAIFQDDFVTYRNLRQYLEQCEYKKGEVYWNLYTFLQNQKLCPGKPEGGERVGWFPSNQKGLGAVALVFDRETVQQLLMNPLHTRHMVTRVMDESTGHRKIDGAVVEALNPGHKVAGAGIKEMVHNPSLVQHVGQVSTIQTDNLKGERPHPQAVSFRGEDFDALDLLRER